MLIRIPGQNAPPAVDLHAFPATLFQPHFMIILHWKPIQFHDHLALDNSVVGRSVRLGYNLQQVRLERGRAVLVAR